VILHRRKAYDCSRSWDVRRIEVAVFLSYRTRKLRSSGVLIGVGRIGIGGSWQQPARLERARAITHGEHLSERAKNNKASGRVGGGAGSFSLTNVSKPRPCGDSEDAHRRSHGRPTLVKLSTTPLVKERRRSWLETRFDTGERV